ncbi:hypothetical protein K2X30_08515 [bacterium]|nr:hypothetical protein [bacterium]
MVILGIPVFEAVCFGISALAHALAIYTISINPPDPKKDPQKPGVETVAGRTGDGLKAATEALKKQEDAKAAAALAHKRLVELSQLYLRQWKAQKDGQKAQVKALDKQIRQQIAQLSVGGVSATKPSPETIDHGFVLDIEILKIVQTEGGANLLATLAAESNKLGELIRAQEREAARLYSPTQPLSWVNQLNARRKVLFDYALKNYNAAQPWVSRTILEKKANSLAASLFVMNMAQDGAWLKNIPNSSLGFRIHNDLIEPVLLLRKGDALQSDFIINLITGEVQKLEENTGNIYDPIIRHYAYLNFSGENTVLDKAELVIAKPYRENPYLAAKQSITQGHELDFGSELFSAQPKHLEAKFKTFKRILPTELLPPKQLAQAETQAQEQGPATQKVKSKEEASAVVDKAMQEVLGQDASKLSEDQQKESLEAMMQMAESLALSQGDKQLLEQLKTLDLSLLQKAKNAKLTPDELKNFEKMAEVLRSLMERKAKSGDTPDFVLDPVVRRATAYELANEFKELTPFIVKNPPLKVLGQRLEKSREVHKVKQGFDFYILHPKKDIVFRTQQEVEVFNRLRFQEKFARLNEYTAAALDEARRTAMVDQVADFLISTSDALPRLGKSKKASTAKPRFTETQLVQILKSLEFARTLIQNANDAMEQIFQNAGKYQDKFEYFNADAFQPLYEIGPRTAQDVASSPKAFVEGIDLLTEDKEAFLRLHLSLRRWAPIFAKSLKLAPSSKTQKVYDAAWTDLGRFWADQNRSYLGAHPGAVAELSAYSPSDDRQDLFKPFLPALTLLTDVDRLEILPQENFECKKDLVWVNLPQGADYNKLAKEKGFADALAWAETAGYKCLVTYWEIVPEGAPPKEKGKYVETMLEYAVIDRRPYEQKAPNNQKPLKKSKARAKEKITLTPENYLGLVLSQPTEQLRNPLVQSLVLRALTEETLQVFKARVLDLYSAEAAAELLNLNPWLAVEKVADSKGPYNIYSFWNKKGVKWQNLQMRFLEDPIQSASRELPVTDQQLLLPEAFAQLLDKALRLHYGKELIDVSLGTKKYSPLKGIAAEQFQENLTQWKSGVHALVWEYPMQSPLRQTTPAALLHPKSILSIYEKRLAVTGVLQEIQMPLDCESTLAGKISLNSGTTSNDTQRVVSTLKTGNSGLCDDLKAAPAPNEPAAPQPAKSTAPTVAPVAEPAPATPAATDPAPLAPADAAPVKEEDYSSPGDDSGLPEAVPVSPSNDR